MRTEKRLHLLMAAVVLGLGALLQATATPLMEVFGGGIDLVLLVVVIWSLWSEVEELVVWGLLGGALLDLFSAAPFGTAMLALGVLAVILSWIGDYLRRSHLLSLIVLVPVATVSYHLALSLILRVLGWPIDYPSTVALVVLPSCLANLIAAPFVYFVLLAARRRPRPAPRLT